MKLCTAKELPMTAHLSNAQAVVGCKLFLNE